MYQSWKPSYRRLFNAKACSSNRATSSHRVVRTINITRPVLISPEETNSLRPSWLTGDLEHSALRCSHLTRTSKRPDPFSFFNSLGRFCRPHSRATSALVPVPADCVPLVYTCLPDTLDLLRSTALDTCVASRSCYTPFFQRVFPILGCLLVELSLLWSLFSSSVL